MVVVRRSEVRVHSRLVIATIDQAKGSPRGYCRVVHGPELKPFGFEHSRKGYEYFYWRVCEFAKKHGCTDIVVGFESTGIYSLPLSYYLIDKPVKLVQVNPMHTKRAKEITDNSPNKTDDKDPRVIADVIELNRWLSVVLPQGVEAELRSATHARERTVVRLTTLYNQLHDVVFAHFPEMIGIMGEMKGKTIRYLLRHHPRPIELVSMGMENLSKLLIRVSRGRFGREMAARLYEAARTSTGVRAGQECRIEEIWSLLDLIETHQRDIDKFEKLMKEKLAAVPYAQYLLSFPGIGELSVAGLIGEMAYFPSFHSAEAALRFGGLNLYEISSGTRKGTRKISKRGRPLIRKILYFATLNMIRKKGIFHSDYQRMLGEGKIKNVALIALARRLMRILYALVHNETDYVENHQSHIFRQAA